MGGATEARTTIGQLVYRGLPPLDFERMIADLDAALEGCGAGKLRPVAGRENLALIDVGASRIGVALLTELDRKGAAAVVVMVGFSPEGRGDTSLARRRAVLARLIADRIAARFSPQETVWSESVAAAEPSLFDLCREEICARLAADLQARAERARAKRGRPLRAVESGDVSRMFARFEQTLAARRSGQPEEAVEEIEGLDYEEPVAAVKQANQAATARMRLAAHLMDATLMLVALPVGAAMMVYSLSRGADIHTSARAMALAGTGVGLLQGAGGLGAIEVLLHLT